VNAIYKGTITHLRHYPRKHAFSYKINMLFIDLDDITKAFAKNWFWSFNRPNLACLMRADFFGPKNKSIKVSIQQLLFDKLQFNHKGKVYLLTSIRYFGYCFNPVSFYYCMDSNDKLVAIVSHITNTPWNEKFAYIHDCRNIPTTSKEFEFDKAFHVSPFIPMDIKYKWIFTPPKDFLYVSMDNIKDEKLQFNATLRLTKKAWTPLSLNKILFLTFPMSIKSIILIYWNAAILYLKGIKFYPHP
jgi:uncharacterized protein